MLIDMDRKWIKTSKKGDQDYQNGLAEFFRFVENNVKNLNKVACPCCNCGNMRFYNLEIVKLHLLKREFDRNYTLWFNHGEANNVVPVVEGKEDGGNSSQLIDSCTNDIDYSMEEIEYFLGSENEKENENDHLNNTFEFRENENEFVFGDKVQENLYEHEHESGDKMSNDIEDEMNEPELVDDPDFVEKLLREEEQPLYPGCSKYTRLSAVLKLYNLKAVNGWTDKSFSDLLLLLTDMLPLGNVLPRRNYEAKKMLSSVGMGYKKYHACPNDCMLYQKEDEDTTHCHTCKASRYKENKPGVPAKVMWYFSPITRFRRWFSNRRDTEQLTWHHNGRIEDGMMRHPADAEQWKSFHKQYPDFASEPRNLHLGFSTDGMNPYANYNTNHSTWPIILVCYNLPPWLCMKRKYMMLSMLISRPKQPGNNIDVYLRPLIDDSKLLWNEGVKVYDAASGGEFNLRAMLLCTLQDYPVIGNVLGYAVKCKTGCRCCEFEFTRLDKAKKGVWLGHR